MVVVSAVFFLGPYLESNKFTFCMDRNALKWIPNLAGAKSIMALWRLSLSIFDLDVVHRTGIKNRAADALSKLETSDIDNTYLDDGLPQGLCHYRASMRKYQGWSWRKLRLTLYLSIVWEFYWDSEQGATRGSCYCPRINAAYGDWKDSKVTKVSASTGSGS